MYEDGKKELPQLSEKLETRTGRHFTAYRDRDGVPPKQRLARDRRESEILYAQWIATNYGPDGHLLAAPIRGTIDSDGAEHNHDAIVTGLPHIVDA